jgi:hypothetical protein
MANDQNQGGGIQQQTSVAEQQNPEVIGEHTPRERQEWIDHEQQSTDERETDILIPVSDKMAQPAAGRSFDTVDQEQPPVGNDAGQTGNTESDLGDGWSSILEGDWAANPGSAANSGSGASRESDNGTGPEESEWAADQNSRNPARRSIPWATRQSGECDEEDAGTRRDTDRNPPVRSSQPGS